MSDFSRFDSSSLPEWQDNSSSKLPPPSLPQPNGQEQSFQDNSSGRRRGRAIFGLAVFASLFGLIGGIVGAFVERETSLRDANSAETVTQVTSAPVVVASDGTNNADSLILLVATRLANSVVTVISNLGEADGRSVGTGVVVTSNGEILTNAHVVEGATSVVVRFAGETEPRVAKILATDVGNDLALIKVEATGLVAATFAKPGSVKIGDAVIAIGYALALDGGPTVTSGIVSAMKRTIETETGALNSLIQTDAAISVDEVLIVIEQLRAQANGVERREGFLGVGLTGREDGGQGAIITDVRAGSPADNAGILVNDIVLSVDGEPIDGQAGLVASIRDAVPGQIVKIEISRDGKRMTFEATLVARTIE